MKKTISLLIIFSFLVSGAWFFKDRILDVYLSLKNWLPFLEKQTINLAEKTLESPKELAVKEILPPPLKAKKEVPNSFLSQEGIIKWTNYWREKNGLPPLRINEKLNNSATLKVEDMFLNQYFEHYSPTGEGVANLVQKAGYQYILIGENLALGNFLNDEILVEGWMESPGHKENILNPYYQEIGVAVKKGTYQGKTTWMAVQHFGLPLSVCPQIDESIKAEIEKRKEELDKLAEILEALEKEIEEFHPKKGGEFREMIEEYNNLASQYNELLGGLKIMVDNYNQQVTNFNQCINKFK